MAERPAGIDTTFDIKSRVSEIPPTHGQPPSSRSDLGRAANEAAGMDLLFQPKFATQVGTFLRLHGHPYLSNLMPSRY
jgi:hypothetical protein